MVLCQSRSQLQYDCLESAQIGFSGLHIILIANKLFVNSAWLNNPFELTLTDVIVIAASRIYESGEVAAYALYCIPQ